jgi:hypothetical protein
MDPAGRDTAGWRPYAPLDAEPRGCSFCGEPRNSESRLVANGDGSVAICEQCTTRFGALFARWRASEGS